MMFWFKDMGKITQIFKVEVQHGIASMTTTTATAVNKNFLFMQHALSNFYTAP